MYTKVKEMYHSIYEVPHPASFKVLKQTFFEDKLKLPNLQRGDTLKNVDAVSGTDSNIFIHIHNGFENMVVLPVTELNKLIRHQEVVLQRVS